MFVSGLGGMAGFWSAQVAALQSVVSGADLRSSRRRTKRRCAALFGAAMVARRSHAAGSCGSGESPSGRPFDRRHHRTGLCGRASGPAALARAVRHLAQAGCSFSRIVCASQARADGAWRRCLSHRWAICWVRRIRISLSLRQADDPADAPAPSRRASIRCSPLTARRWRRASQRLLSCSPPTTITSCRPIMSEAVAAAIPGAKLMRFPRGGHFFPKTRADDYNAALADFWAEAGR